MYFKQIRAYLLIILSFITFLLPAQTSENAITGTLVNTNNEAPVGFANVYVSGTSIGTMSDENGNFSLSGFSLPCLIVVSHISYKVSVFEVKNISEPIKVKLIPKNIAISEVMIESSNLRNRNIQLFNDWFLGIDYWGENAKLVNEEDLRFKKDSTGFYATANKTLEVELPLLGYRVLVDLVSFKVYTKDKFEGPRLSLLAYYYFIPMKIESYRQKKKINKNRLKAYYFSTLHFCRSLYDQSLTENGYIITKRIWNKDTNEIVPVQLKGEYLKTKNNTEYLRFTGLKDSCYQINYYSRNGGEPINLNIRESIKVDFASLYFDSNNCIIRNDGTIPDNSILFGGKIGYKRVGAMLPENFYPDLNE